MLKDAINFPQVQHPFKNHLDLCYEIGTNNNAVNVVPDLQFGFDGGKVVLRPLNTFLLIAQSVICAAFLDSKSSDSTFGNVAQQNFKVRYDLPNMKVTFQPMNYATGNQ